MRNGHGLKCHIGGYPCPYNKRVRIVLLIAVNFSSSGSQSWSRKSTRESGEIAMHCLLATYVLMSLYWRRSPAQFGSLLNTSTLNSSSQPHNGRCHIAVYTQLSGSLSQEEPQIIHVCSHNLLNRLTPNAVATIKFFLIILIKHNLSFLWIPTDLCTP